MAAGVQVDRLSQPLALSHLPRLLLLQVDAVEIVTKYSMMGKIPPKGVSFSNYIRIFAMSCW
jgi:hypothetical protein